MKLLLDENLSPRLLTALTEIFPNSAHVDRIGLGAASDSEVWTFAKENDFTIVSKDSDFYEKSMLYGHPPKVIWVKRGNCTNQQIAMLLANKVESIQEFFKDETISFIRIK